MLVLLVLMAGLAALNAAEPSVDKRPIPTPLSDRMGDQVVVDFSRTNGVIRPLHGVNLGPLCYRGMVDLSSYHRELRLPLTRLHDVVWVNADAVDISTIFRDFRNDPLRPESYEFAPTDDYIYAIVQAGSPILYRLGESIEHTPRKYRVHPPSAPAKWAQVCCQIIQHYNEGWNHGFHHGIKYWEIWNEPENQPAMWTGTEQQFFELYEITAKAIKSRWPELKVGGPSVGYTGRFHDGQFEPGDFLRRFLEFCRDHQVPLDFFSWHGYAGDPADYASRARALRQLLDANGFTRTESHLNEWNYLPDEDWQPMMPKGQGVMREQWTARMRGPEGAAFAAWTLMALQDAPVDMANFYTAEIQAFGMFNFNGVPQKTYYAFRAFRELLDTPRRVEAPSCVAGHVASCAGLNLSGTSAAVLLSNFNSGGAPTELMLRGLPWSVPTHFAIKLVDASHEGQELRNGTVPPVGALTLPELKAPAVILLKLSPTLRTP